MPEIKPNSIRSRQRDIFVPGQFLLPIIELLGESHVRQLDSRATSVKSKRRVESKAIFRVSVMARLFMTFVSRSKAENTARLVGEMPFRNASNSLASAA